MLGWGAVSFFHRFPDWDKANFNFSTVWGNFRSTKRLEIYWEWAHRQIHPAHSDDLNHLVFSEIWVVPKMVAPNNHGVFLLKMIILGVFWGYHHLRKPRYALLVTNISHPKRLFWVDDVPFPFRWESWTNVPWRGINLRLKRWKRWENPPQADHLTRWSF